MFFQVCLYNLFMFCFGLSLFWLWLFGVCLLDESCFFLWGWVFSLFRALCLPQCIYEKLTLSGHFVFNPIIFSTGFPIGFSFVPSAVRWSFVAFVFVPLVAWYASFGNERRISAVWPLMFCFAFSSYASMFDNCYHFKVSLLWEDFSSKISFLDFLLLFLWLSFSLGWLIFLLALFCLFSVFCLASLGSLVVSLSVGCCVGDWGGEGATSVSLAFSSSTLYSMFTLLKYFSWVAQYSFAILFTMSISSQFNVICSSSITSLPKVRYDTSRNSVAILFHAEVSVFVISSFVWGSMSMSLFLLLSGWKHPTISLMLVFVFLWGLTLCRPGARELTLNELTLG